MNKSTVSSVMLASVIAATQVYAQNPGAVAPDNSKANKVDASNTTSSADTQSNSATDVDLTKRIRQSVMADKSLSTYAHNVKIVTNGGQVTLNGVVRSEAEKKSVEMKAADIAGNDRVMSHLKINAGN